VKIKFYFVWRKWNLMALRGLADKELLPHALTARCRAVPHESHAPARPMPGAPAALFLRKRENMEQNHTGGQKHVHNEVSIANQLRNQAERSLLDRLLVPNSGSRGESDPSLIGSLTAAAVRLHSPNRKTSVTVPSESHANKNIRSQCTVLTLFALR